METNKPTYTGRGGWRGGGRPHTDLKCTLSVRVSAEAIEMLNTLTTNKSAYFDALIREKFAEAQK